MKPKIITGQQIHLLGGPLFVTYKVMGALKKAAEVNGEAVYWLESNDADFEEISHFYYLDQKGELKKVSWPIATGGQSIGSILVNKKLVDIIKTFFKNIQQTEFTADLRAMVLDCYQPGENLAQASNKLARAIFKDYPLCFFNPSDPAFLDFCKPLLLKEAGAAREGEQADLFFKDQGVRKPLFKKNGNFTDRQGNIIKPEKFTLLPNYKTRPLCQDAWFKTNSYIAGPSEIRYLNQLDYLYKRHALKQAKIIPRMSALLVEKRHWRHLQRLGLNPASLPDMDWAALKNKILSHSGYDRKKLDKDCRLAAEKYFNSLAQSGLPLKDLKKETEQTLKKALGIFRKEVKEKNSRQLHSREILELNYHPLNCKQERIYNLFQFANLYGLDKVLELIYNNYGTEKTFLEIGND